MRWQHRDPVDDLSTVDELTGIRPQSNLWKWLLLVAQLTNLVISLTADLGICKRHNLVEIAEASWREADRFTVAARLLASPILQEYDAFTVEVLAMNPASFQPVEIVDARLLARQILQDYDAFHNE